MPTRKKTPAADTGEAAPILSADDLFSQLTTQLTAIETTIAGLDLSEQQRAAMDTCADLRMQFRAAVRRALKGRAKVKNSGLDKVMTRIRTIQRTLDKVQTTILTARAEAEMAQVSMREMIDAAAEVQRQEDAVKARRKMERQQAAQARAQAQITRLQEQMQGAQRRATAS